MKLLVLLLILIPATEVFVLLTSVQWIGAIPTFAIMIVTAVIGAFLAKRQSTSLLQDIRTRMERGELPGDAVLDGICILVGGILLMTPGYVTDIAGVILLLSATRVPVKQLILKKMEAQIRRKQVF
ncbi:membrane protein FxsA [Ectobacillus antri]|uniref:Membrane protein FxsA n=1 Tax=Ectobacillus antri TaxID=2486280 RepID=A0ABT6H2U7_9BACI|nr:FxsA family protein [Ectobacillus antri]MDG4656533.1 membrane protein FxsA [Ectobacillus antri]MDG5753583.1 membrane protein FxsA [Ectobacillus antri]